MGQKREEVVEAGRDAPIVRRALDCHRAGLMDYETAMEAAVLIDGTVICAGCRDLIEDLRVADLDERD